MYSKPRIYRTSVFCPLYAKSVICVNRTLSSLCVNRTMSVLHDVVPYTNWRGPSRPEHPPAVIHSWHSGRSNYDAPPELAVFPLLRALKKWYPFTDHESSKCSSWSSNPSTIQSRVLQHPPWCVRYKCRNFNGNALDRAGGIGPE
jgi:hypothetical protein